MTLHLFAPPEAEDTPTAPRTGTRLDPLSPIRMTHTALEALATQATANVELMSTRAERALAAARADTFQTALLMVRQALEHAEAIQEASQCP